VVSWPLADQWNKRDGLLDIGDEVTVYRGLAGKAIDQDLFWAVVKNKISEQEYQVEGKTGAKFSIQHNDLHVRK
jgi:hypothetical protein